MIRTSLRMKLCAAWLVLTLCFIWGNSLLPGKASTALSDGVKEITAEVVSGGDSSGISTRLLRKAAHFTEFAVLGMALAWLFSMLGRKPHWPLLFGLLAACMDEGIQLLVPGRSASPWDAAIDTCGMAAGMTALFLGHSIFKKHRLENNTQ